MNRQDFFSLFVNCPSDDVRQIQTAYWLAKEVHRTTPNRDSGERYFEHPRRVATLLAGLGFTDARVIVLALLHDAIEDTPAPLAVYEKLFGAHTAVSLLTLSKKIPKYESVSGMIVDYMVKPANRYYGDILGADLNIRLVKVADRIDNLETLDAFEEDRRRRYIEETKKYMVPVASTTNEELYHMMSRLTLGLSAR